MPPGLFKRSDSGERCGVKKEMTEEEGDWGERCRNVTSSPPSLLLFRPPFYF